MKKYIYTFALLVLGLTACNKEAEVPQEVIGEADATVYQVSIPASMGADTKAVSFDNSTNPPTASTSFQATDKVYLYNKTTSKWISYNSGTSSFEYLSPSNLTGEGKRCDLTGNITGTISVDDEILLLYNMNHLDSDPTECAYNYRDQDGTAEGVLDGAIATLKVKAINGSEVIFCNVSDESDEKAHFQNLQSMFRFKFTAGGEPINVKRFSIRAEHAMLAYTFMPIPPADADYDWGAVGASLATPTSDYIYIGLLFEDGGNYNIHFLVTDADGKVYTGSKAAPSGGFQNGRYYYNTNAIDLTYQYTLAEPTITWTTPSVAVDPSFANWYIIPDNNADISLSGTSMGYGFWLQQNATVRLNDFTGTYPVTDDIFLEGDGNLTIEVNGTNSIVNANDYAGICTYMGDVKLCGNGTLSITSNDENHYGIEADNYDGTDVSVLAALGHTVTRSDMTDNGDGTYTWTYTVMPGTKVVNLSSLTESYTAQDGDILTGELSSNLELYIPAGATVTLAGMTHQAGNNKNGITCQGTTNIILAEGTINDLTRGDENAYNGILLNCSDEATLTISGSGTLLASGGNGNGYSGIGGNNNNNHIVINGGNITATGGHGAPGIGSNAAGGHSGNITINGGTVNAMGGDYASGIGAGRGTTHSPCQCGTITFNGGTTVVMVGSASQFGIGAGSGNIYFTNSANGCSVMVYGGIKSSPSRYVYIDGLQVSSTVFNSNLFVYPSVSLKALSANYVAQDGDVLTGRLTGNYKISIADGATVTLAGITINGGDDLNAIWAGITCEGDATLVLADCTDNLVKPFNSYHAAISVPSGKTLTIQGSGSLTADARSSSGAGIGGNNVSDYGNIVITGAANVTAYGGGGSAGIGSGPCDRDNAVTGSDITINTSGTVKAYGGDRAAGIGAGASGRDQDNRCGNILISKGTVEAIGGEYGAGIGTGFGNMGSSICGTITITDGVTSVTATKGAYAGNCIGHGYGGPCGTVTIGGTEYWGPTAGKLYVYEYKNGGDTYLTTSPLVYEPNN